jgi:hypothetical protein
LIEVVGYGDLSNQKADPGGVSHVSGIDRHHFDQRLSGLRDDERLALCRLFDQA